MPRPPTGALARADDWTVSPIRIASGASVGAGAVVVAGRDVGSFALVGAGAVVTRDVPAHALVVGNPARRIGWVCACAERLVDPAGNPVSAEPVAIGIEVVCPACGRRYSSIDAGGTLRELVPSGRDTGAPA